MDCNEPGSSVHGISLARILEWVPFPSPGDPPQPGIEPTASALADGFRTTEPGKGLVLATAGKELIVDFRIKRNHPSDPYW